MYVRGGTFVPGKMKPWRVTLRIYVTMGLLEIDTMPGAGVST